MMDDWVLFFLTAILVHVFPKLGGNVKLTYFFQLQYPKFQCMVYLPKFRG